LSSKLTFENFVPVKFFGMERREENLLEGNIVVYNKAAWKNEVRGVCEGGVWCVVCVRGFWEREREKERVYECVCARRKCVGR